MKKKKTFTTVEEVLTEVLGKAPANSKSNLKRYDLATPTRISHLTEMITEGLAPLEVIEQATQQLYASGWLKKPAREVTKEDLEKLLKAAPWNDPNYKADRDDEGLNDDQGDLFDE